MGKVISFSTYLSENKYLIALLCAFNFLLTPISIVVSGLDPAYIVVMNYSVLIISSSFIATNKKAKLITYILGLSTLIAIWTEFSSLGSNVVFVCRILFSFLLFVTFCTILVRQLIRIKEVTLMFILGPILGFIYFGIMGGILFELIHFLLPGSFQLTDDFSGYSFYYFSFISITSVGYGDITPISAPAQSLTLVMNIIGQFYLAIVIGVFVGKYINAKSE